MSSASSPSKSMLEGESLDFEAQAPHLRVARVEQRPCTGDVSMSRRHIAPSDLRIIGSAVSQHSYEHRSERSVLLAVDQESPKVLVLGSPISAITYSRLSLRQQG
jgi:hypothetical protein